MRLQLILITSAFFWGAVAFAQQDSSKIHLEDIDISFIASYYQQDGIHSPVTGGQGTEQLSNVAPIIYVNIPLDTVRVLSASAGVDFYTSASSDNIDNPYLSDNQISGASANDIRHHYTLAYTKKKTEKRSSNTWKAGLSSEYDVTSLSAGYGFEKDSKNKMWTTTLGAMYFFDDWKLIYPVELRAGNKQYLSQDKRHSLNVSLSESFIINKKINGSLTTEFTVQSGMLSTPFHRVYFSDQLLPKVEMLPDLRVKVPVGLRFNVHMTDRVILRTFNRVYWDSWGMTGYTGELELPIKAADWLRLYPFYRYHMQNGINYFGEYGTHLSTDQFYTSDFDLSTLSSMKYGLGFTITPLFGVARFKWVKDQVLLLKSTDLRFAYYDRSDGLNAWIITGGLNFKIKR